MELTKKAKVFGLVLVGDKEFYAIEAPKQMINEETGLLLEHFSVQCVNSIPMNLDVLALDETAQPVYDEPFVVLFVTNMIVGMAGLPKEVEYLNPQYEFEYEELEPDEETKELMSEMSNTFKSENVE